MRKVVAISVAGWLLILARHAVVIYSKASMAATTALRQDSVFVRVFR